MEATFLFGIIWSIGATLVQKPNCKERDSLDAFLRQKAGLPVVDRDTVMAGQLPLRSLYDYCFLPAESSWKVMQLSHIPCMCS